MWLESLQAPNHRYTSSFAWTDKPVTRLPGGCVHTDTHTCAHTEIIFHLEAFLQWIRHVLRMWVYLEKQGYDLATVNSSGLLPAGVQQVSGSNPGVCNTLVVAQQPHKHVWNCVLGLEIVRMYMCEWEKLSYIRQILKNDISKFTLFPVPASQFWLRFFHLFYLYNTTSQHQSSEVSLYHKTNTLQCQWENQNHQTNPCDS